jgi:hypothetical protein
MSTKSGIVLLWMVMAFSLTNSPAFASQSGLRTPNLQEVTTSQLTALPFDDQSQPVYLIASYYSAINLGNYARAYAYWDGHEPNSATLGQFIQGFANTESVEGWAILPLATEGAAGSLYAEVPVLLRATLTDGDQQLFAGCFTAHRSNVPVGDNTEPDPNWHLFDATLEEVDALGVDEATATCTRAETFPLSSPFNDALQPVDLLISYYDAVARGDYARAYSYWSGQPRNQTLEDFVDGFVGTDDIGVIVGLNFVSEGAAGSIYTDIPTVITATNNGASQYFAGCFVARKSNVPVGDATEPDPNWRFFDAEIVVVEGFQAGLDMTAQGCAI